MVTAGNDCDDTTRDSKQTGCWLTEIDDAVTEAEATGNNAGADSPESSPLTDPESAEGEAAKVDDCTPCSSTIWEGLLIITDVKSVDLKRALAPAEDVDIFEQLLSRVEIELVDLMHSAFDVENLLLIEFSVSKRS